MRCLGTYGHGMARLLSNRPGTNCHIWLLKWASHQNVATKTAASCMMTCMLQKGRRHARTPLMAWQHCHWLTSAHELFASQSQARAASKTVTQRHCTQYANRWMKMYSFCDYREVIATSRGRQLPIHHLGFKPAQTISFSVTGASLEISNGPSSAPWICFSTATTA
jgi:hypothetical protein